MRTLSFINALLAASALALSGCGSSSPNAAADADGSGGGSGNGSGNQPPIARSACAAADFPSPEFTQCEAENFAKVGEAPAEQTASAEFNQRLLSQSRANLVEYNARTVSDPLWNSTENLCATWAQNCVGDPLRYPETDAWYGTIGSVTPVNFYDAEGARLSGRV